MNDEAHLSQIFKGWDNYQDHLVEAIGPLTADQLNTGIAPHLRTIYSLAAHIITTRVWWFHFVLQEGPESLRAFVTWSNEDEPAHSAAEVVDGLQQTWEAIEACLERWTPADLSQEFTYERPGRPKRQLTRQWVIFHVLEHDIHHGGELGFSLGAAGLPAIDL